MWIDVHAVALLLLPIAILLAMALLPRRTPTDRQLGIAALVSGLPMAFMASLRHLCSEGAPLTQWLIPGVCGFVVLAFVEPAVWRRGFAVLSLLCMILLCNHFLDVAHGPGWTGNPGYAGTAQVLLGTLQRQIRSGDKFVDDLDVEYAAGWLRDMNLTPEARKSIGRLHLGRSETYPVWHSRLTGLYRCEGVPRDFWYPGGKFSEVGAEIELRDR